MNMRTAVVNSVLALTVVSCLTIVGCGGKKDSCERCSNDGECESGDCTEYTTSDGSSFLLCSGRNTCDVPR
jgi:hypothetical protein